MAEGNDVVRLEDNFYRDSFGKVIFVIFGICASIFFLAAVSVYIYINRPPPTTFRVAGEWRVLAPVPIDQPYLASPDMLQWVSNVVPNLFDLDYLHMDTQIADAKKYFTENGYQVYLNQLKNYIDPTIMKNSKMFSHGDPTRAPVIVNQGVLSGRYAWWVQIPINISYAGGVEKQPVDLTLQILVVRTETTNNLMGISIDNVIVDSGAGKPLKGTGGA